MVVVSWGEDMASRYYSRERSVFFEQAYLPFLYLALLRRFRVHAMESILRCRRWGFQTLTSEIRTLAMQHGEGQ